MDETREANINKEREDVQEIPTTQESALSVSETEYSESDSAETAMQKPEEKKPRRRSWVAIVAAFAAGFAACIGVFAALTYGAGLGRIVPKADYDYYEDLSNKLGKYYVIMQMIDEDPLVKESSDKLIDDAVRDKISKLEDPYAAYFTKEEYEEFSKPFAAGYVGVGIVVEQTAEGVFAVQIFEGGPAESAGMQAGDKIVRIDDKEPTDIEDAVSRMMGDAGTKVTVTVLRDGTEHDLEMTRAEIDMPSVSHSVVEGHPDIGYIAVSVFADDTDDEFKKAVEDLEKQGIKKVILDLRDNGGGLTNTSISIADYLLPEGMIMSEVNKEGESTEYKSDAESAGIELAVLVNGNTASAAEILTAAIKENDGGKVIGTKTFGKGVTQLSRKFKDGTAIKMTVTEYLTPDGNHVQEKGIEPDIEAEGEEAMNRAIEELSD